MREWPRQRTSLSGGISRFASQSQAPLPSDTAPVPVPALAGVMPSSLASLMACVTGRGFEAVIGTAPPHNTRLTPAKGVGDAAVMTANDGALINIKAVT